MATLIFDKQTWRTLLMHDLTIRAFSEQYFAAKLQNANLIGADITAADFTWSNPSLANLMTAFAYETDFTHAIMGRRF